MMTNVRFVLAALALASAAVACSADPSPAEGDTGSSQDALGGAAATHHVVSPRDPAAGKASPAADPSTPPAGGDPSTGKPPSTQPCVEVKLCPLGQTWDVTACDCAGPIHGRPSAGGPMGPSTP